MKNIEVITDPGAKYDAEVSVVSLISLQRKMLYKDIPVRFVNGSSLGRVGGGGYIP